MTLFRSPEWIAVTKALENNRTWDSYEQGFMESGTILGWVGFLNLIQILRHQKPDEVVLRLTVGDSMFEQTYHGFDLSEGTYALTYTSVSFSRKRGTVPEISPDACFSADMKGVPFSTWDNDNDADPEMNCAAEAGGGWWFRTCNASCHIFLPGYDPVEPEPESITRLRFGDLDVRAWADTFGPVALLLRESLD